MDDIKENKSRKGPYNVKISPNGKYMIATLKGSGETAIWQLEDGLLIKTIKNSTSVPHVCNFK